MAMVKDRKIYTRAFIIAFLTLLMTSCVNHKSRLDELSLQYNGKENVFPKTAGYAFAYEDNVYTDKRLGKSVSYKFIKKPDAKITVYLYSNYLNGAKNLDEAIEKNISSMTYAIKKNTKITSLTRKKENKIKKHFDTKIAYNQITVNKARNEHIYMTRVHNQVVKVRVSSVVGKDLEEMSDFFVGNVIAYLKKSMNDQRQKVETTK